ncbi:MAG: hypothetical protein WCK73_08515, partial [Deltaproteobacteria bacterium]
AGRFLLAVRPDRASELEARLAGAPFARIGAFESTGRLRISVGRSLVVDDEVGALALAWKREGGRS